ncbi:MAG: ankyrin repeat domain-containing protein [Firmicutes bacterium]|nr:ankyrin repeat domain-containing protein [Bacillota bacterium]
MDGQKRLAIKFLNYVYQENIPMIRECIKEGASPSWIFNGFPILVHAVNLGNKKIVKLLIDEGADQLQEAFGFALEREIGEVIPMLYYRGIVPKRCLPRPGFGAFPQQYAY